MNAIKPTLLSVFVLAGATLAGASAHAAPACDPVSPVVRRIVERAEGDVAALRGFVWGTAIVYGINMIDVRENLDKWRAAVECRKQMAAASAPVVTARR